MRKLLLLAFLSLSLPAPRLLGGVGPEFELAPPVIAAAPGNQAGASIASDGSSFFSVWTDSRTASPQLYGTRVDANGTVLDETGVILPARQVSESHIVWVAPNYLAVWSEGESKISVARVSREGVPVDAEARNLFPEPSFLKGVASNGTRAAILAQKSDGTVFITIVGPDANVAATVDLPRPAPGESITDLDIAWNGSMFVVAQAIVPITCFECGWVERVSFISPEGLVLRQVDTPALLMAGRYTIAALPDRFIVAAATWTKGYNAWIFTNDGHPVGATLGFAWDTPAGSPVAAIADDASFVLVWEEWKSPAARLLGMRIGADGNGITLPTVLATSSTPFNAPAIARSSAGTFAVSWSASSSTGETDVFSRVIGPSLTPQTDTALLSRAAATEQKPVVGTNGHSWLVSWVEGDGVSKKLLARRFASDGIALDAVPLEVAPVSYLNETSIASDGRGFLIVWGESGTLFFKRLSSNGEWIDLVPRLIGTGAWDLSRQAAGWDGRNYFVVWSRFEPETVASPFSVVGSFIGAEGVVSAPVVISPNAMAGNDAALARIGDRWLVVWTYMPPFPCQILCPGGDTDIIGTRVTSEGVVVDPIPIQFSIPNALKTDFATSPMLASAGDSVLVAWKANRTIRATRISADGIIDGGVGGDGFPLLKLAGNWSDVRVGWDGRDYLMLVSDPAVDSPKPVMLYRFWSPEALGNGVELSFGWIPLFNGMFDTALGARPGGKAIAIYPRIAGPEYGGVNRLFARTVAARERVRPTKR